MTRRKAWRCGELPLIQCLLTCVLLVENTPIREVARETPVRQAGDSNPACRRFKR